MSKARELVERYKQGKLPKQFKEASYWQLAIRNQLNTIVNQLNVEQSDENAVKIQDKLKSIIQDLDLLYLKVTGSKQDLEQVKAKIEKEKAQNKE